MDAGRELDALVAKKIMGLRVFQEPPYDINPVLIDEHEVITGVVPPYSTDISAAWIVVNKLHEGRGRGFARVITVHHFWPGYAECEIISEPEGGSKPREHWPSVFVFGGTPAHAICLAALKAVES